MAVANELIEHRIKPDSQPGRCCECEAAVGQTGHEQVDTVLREAAYFRHGREIREPSEVQTQGSISSPLVEEEEREGGRQEKKRRRRG